MHTKDDKIYYYYEFHKVVSESVSELVTLMCDGSAHGWLAGDGWVWSKWLALHEKLLRRPRLGSFNKAIDQ